MKERSLVLLLAAFALGAAFCPIISLAAAVSWVGGSGDWNTAANWSTGALPGTNDDVVIGSGPGITVTHSSGEHTVRSLMSQQAFQLTGGTLAVSNTAQVNNVLTISGGALAQATVLQGTNGASFVVAGGTLDGVTVNGTLDVGNSRNGANLTVTNGLTLNGTALVGNPTTEWFGLISFSGSQSLMGNGTVVFGIDGDNYVYLVDSGTTLTFGPGITVHGQNGNIGNGNGSVVNQGTISADVAGGTITIFAQPFTNQGLVESVAGKLNIAGTLSTGGLGNFQSGGGPLVLSGALDNTGQTLVLNGSTNTLTLQGGTILGGTVVTTNGGSLVVWSTGSLQGGLAVNGVLDVGNSYNEAVLAVFGGGLALNGTALVGNPTNDSAGQIQFGIGNATLGGNGTVVFGHSSANTLRMDTESDNPTLTIGPGITVHGQNGTIEGNAVVNQGTISADVAGGTIRINVQFNNTGTLSAPIGTLSFSGSPSLAGGAINVGIGGLSSSVQINFGGGVSLGGVLDVSLNDDYLPTTGDAFTLLTYRSRSGAFSAVNLPTEAVWQISNAPTALIIAASSGCAPPSGVVAWWPMEGAPNDLVGTNNPSGTNAISYFPGEVGLGVTFGNGGYVDIPDSGELANQTFSFVAWAMPNGQGPINPHGDYSSCIIGKDVDCCTEYGLWWGTYDSVDLTAALPKAANSNFLFTCGSNWSNVIVSADSFAPGSFYHVAGTYDGSAFRLYVNGVLEGQLSSSQTIIYDPSIPWTIGNEAPYWRNQGWEATWNGVIDEVAVFNRALSSNEIAAIYAAGSAGMCMAERAPIIVAQPTSQNVTENNPVTFRVLAEGAAPLAYQWQFNGTNLTDGGQISGSQSNLLTIAGLITNNVGNYVVVLTNAYGAVTSSVASLMLNPGLFWTNPLPVVYGTALGPAQLNASASVPGTNAYNPPAGTVLSAGTNSLVVVFTPADAVHYDSATETVGIVVSPAPLSVLASNATRAFGQPNPPFTGSITGLTNGDNIAASFSCAAVPASPPGMYDIIPSLVDPGSRLGNYTVSTSDGTLTVGAGPPPTLTGIAPARGLTNGGTMVTLMGSGFEVGAGVMFGVQGATGVTVNSPTQLTALTPAGPLGAVHVVLTNPDGTVATLTNGFTYTGPPPAILTQPTNQLVVQGTNAVFQVSALYAAGYQWQFNGGNLTDNGRITGSRGNVLTISWRAIRGRGLLPSHYHQCLWFDNQRGGYTLDHWFHLGSSFRLKTNRWASAAPQRLQSGSAGARLSAINGCKSEFSVIGRDQCGVDFANVQTTNQRQLQRGGEQCCRFSHECAASDSDSAQLLRERRNRARPSIRWAARCRCRCRHSTALPKLRCPIRAPGCGFPLAARPAACRQPRGLRVPPRSTSCRWRRRQGRIRLPPPCRVKASPQRREHSLWWA